MATIVIDAGHGGADPGAVFEGRQEKDDTLRLALAVGKILEENGQNVIYTRTTDVYQTPFQKATIGNEARADFFVSIHRNSSPVAGQYSGVETLVVLRRTKMPAVLVEAGFINNGEDNRIFDENFEEVAQAIADGILQTIYAQEVESYEYEKEAETPYRIQLGFFNLEENARALQAQLLFLGYDAVIEPGEDGTYRVYSGSFEKLDNAAKMEQTLRKAGFSTYIVQ